MDDHDDLHFIQDLPPISTKFHIPYLADEPQNSILNGIRLKSLPIELAVLVDDKVNHPIHPPKLLDDALWDDAVKTHTAKRSLIRSWDALRSSYNQSASPSPFLSEQSPSVFAAAQYSVQPLIHNPIYVSQHDLLNDLKMVVLGTSSALHIWHPVTETFVPQHGVVLIDGKNQVVSESFMKRFLTIGTLLRRIETLVTSLRSKSAKSSPTLHAFAHALLSVITYLRDVLAQSPPSNVGAGLHMLAAISLHYVRYEELAVALGSLCHRDIHLSPEEYPPIDSNPATLLSLIHTHLSTHLESQSSRLISASFAYILNTTSQDYLRHVCRSIGLGLDGTAVLKNLKPMMSSDMFDDEEDEDEVDVFEELREAEEGNDIPMFFGPEVRDALKTARRSLVLLRAAQPDHPLLTQKTAVEVVWLWTEEEVEAAWAGLPLPKQQAAHVEREVKLNPAYKPELAAQFSLFDLDPGEKFPALSPVEAFIDRFPACLPGLTPTLSHLTFLSFRPLISHASALSQALLSLFLSPSPFSSSPTPKHLVFNDHLTLLRSYILLTSHAFKSRLAAALFSDAGEFDIDHDPHSQARHANNVQHSEHQQWAVGLAPALTDRESWPPGGADLSFLLRTVIVDSLEKDMRGGQQEERGREEEEGVWEEAEWRLGFAIRDLPIGPGRDRWLNPTSIEALDFLYIDYRPPHPLDVLITPEILSKYQRMFAFILRLMRVEHVSKALFRMTRKNTERLFPTLTSSNKLLLHFRFIAHSFLTALSSYVFDTAIGGNFDAFLARLSNPQRGAGFSDVFAVADAHSDVLDHILSACLLRSGQRAVGDLLRGALEIVLELGVLAGERQRGRLEEYQAAPLLDDLYTSFRRKMSTLTKVLKGLIDKGSTISRLQLEAAMRETAESGSRRSPGGVECLYHLLMRLDLGDWWAESFETA